MLKTDFLKNVTFLLHLWEEIQGLHTYIYIYLNANTYISIYFYTEFFYDQIEKFLVGIGDKKITPNQIAMQDRKCRTYELWCKEAEIRDKDSNRLIEQKIFYWK